MARFKSVSFREAPHPVSLKFKDDDPLFARVAEMSSAQIREAIGCESYDELLRKARQRNLAPHAFIHECLAIEPAPRQYSGWPAGTLEASERVRRLVRVVRARHVLDPFAGRANYAAAAAQVPRVRALYCEISPVYQFIAESRNRALFCRCEVRESIAQELIAGTSGPITDDLARCAAIEAMTKQDLREQLRNAAEFVRNELALHAPVHRIADDARTLALLQPIEIDCVITNPPSLNFAAYATPEAMRLVGARRDRVRKLQPPAEALERMRRALGNTIKPIRNDVERLQRVNPRMARIAANYFADMVEAFAAIASQMTPHGTIAIEVDSSSLAGIDVNTPSHLEAILKALGFRDTCDEEQFRVNTR